MYELSTFTMQCLKKEKFCNPEYLSEMFIIAKYKHLHLLNKIPRDKVIEKKLRGN